MEKDLTPEWILKETLSIQRQAISDYVHGAEKDNGLTLTVIGCGTMGLAILRGVLEAITSFPSPAQISPYIAGTSISGPKRPTRLPNKFNACVRRGESAELTRTELGKYNARFSIFENDIVSAVTEAEVIILCCKPHDVATTLDCDNMRAALKNKTLISILAEVKEADLRTILYGDEVPQDACSITQAIPTAAATICESMTLIAISDPPLPIEKDDLITWIFTRIGRVIRLPSSKMNVSTALASSGTAFASITLECLAVGAIDMGIPREEAYIMAAQTMRGTTGLVLRGEHPADLKDAVCTPSGHTTKGVSVLEESGMRDAVSRAVREATAVIGQSG